MSLTRAVPAYEKLLPSCWCCLSAVWPRYCSCGAAGQIFGWEAIISFILVSVVYAVAIGSPSFGAQLHLC